MSHDGISALRQFSAQRYDLVVLDIMLPGIDGLEVCRRLRAEGPYVPILMLTAKSAELDRVLGLEIGADDYVTKPFSLNELLARVKALFRRVDSLSAPPVREFIRHGILSIDISKRTVAIAESAVELTAKEFDLLVQFAAHPGRVYSRAQLLDAVWGSGHEGYEHTVNSHINRLRAKIERDPAHPQLVLTVWGVGYKFAENPG
jgi:DNA-binding response OmpR family regulator